MSTNKFFYIPEWQTTATVSNPDVGFAKIYPKSTDGFWYLVDSSGNEKRIEFAYYPKNGFTVTTFPVSNPLGYQLDLSIGDGLTFSGDFVGSSVSVYNVTPSLLKSTGGATAGYLLSTDGSDFVWTPFSFPGVSGSVGKLARFDSSSSVGDSIISDDGSIIVIGTTPSFAVSLLNVTGTVSLIGNVHINDDLNVFMKHDNGFFFQTDEHFRIVDETGYPYLSLMTDNISVYTFSVLDNAIFISDDGTYKYLESNLNSALFGSTASSFTFSIYSGTAGALVIKDGNEGTDKVLTSDSNGVSTWQSLGQGSGINLSGLTISIGLSGYGLTFSSDDLSLDYGIFGSSLTHSSGIVDLSLTGVTSGAYGNSSSVISLTVDNTGRISNIEAFTISLPIYDDYVSYPNDKGLTANYVNFDGGTASNTPISQTPIPGSYVVVYINGQEYQVGNGTTNSSCYFGTNSVTPKGFSVSNAIQAGDYLYWNPSIAGFNLEIGYRIALHYMVTPGSFGIYGFTGATGLQGPTGADGATGSIGLTGSDGANSVRWKWSNAAVSPLNDPGANYFYSDTSSIGSITSLSISKDELNSIDVYNWFVQLSALLSNGNPVYLQFSEVGNSSNMGIFTVNSSLNYGTYFDISLTCVFGNGTLTNDTIYSISWIANGVAGANGADGVDGSNSTRWIFTTSTTSPADPTSNYFNADVTDFASVSNISISTTDLYSNDFYTWLSNLESANLSGRDIYLQITTVGSPYWFGTYQISNIVNNTTWFDFTLSNILSASGSMNDTKTYVISYIVGGLNGATGTAGSLQDTLAVGNTMGTYSINMSSGKLESSGGTSSFAMSDTTTNFVTHEISFTTINSSYGYPEIRTIVESATTGTASSSLYTIPNASLPTESVCTVQVISQAIDPTNSLYYSNNLFSFFYITGGVVSQVGTSSTDVRTNLSTGYTDVTTDGTDINITVEGDSGSSLYWVLRIVYMISTAV